LGRIVEASGFIAYPAYIQSQIMPLCDVQTVALAGDTLAERQRDEVVYYKSSGASSGPYDIPVARMDSHGGLISSAIDVVRFAIHLDGLPAVPDILSSASIASMTTPTSDPYLQEPQWLAARHHCVDRQQRRQSVLGGIGQRG
jgi:hypothetical protein